MPCAWEPWWGYTLGPLGPGGPAGGRLSARTAKPLDPPSAGAGPVRFPRLLLPNPFPASPQTQSSWGEPYFRETGRPHWVASSRSKLPPAARQCRAKRRLPHALRFSTPSRSATLLPRVTVGAPECLPLPRRLSTWETCEMMPCQGGGISQRRPSPFRRRREWPLRLPHPQPTSA